MSMKDKMMDMMMGKMSKEEKDKMMDQMMEKFFADMTPEDKQKMMEKMMPKMMEGINMMEMMPQMMKTMMGGDAGECGPVEMMSNMMGGDKEKKTSIMPQMMMEMMPRCLTMILPSVETEKRVAFVLKMMAALIEHGSAGMSEEEKEDFVAKAIEEMKI